MPRHPDTRRVMNVGQEPELRTEKCVLVHKDSTNIRTKKRRVLSVKARIQLKKLAVFWPVKVAQILCILYSLAMTFIPAPVGVLDIETGDIIDVESSENTDNGIILINGDERPVVAQGTFELVSLAISRASAFSLYPVMVLVFLTKCKATMSFFNKTPLSMYTIQDSHELHSYCGRYIAFLVWIHTIFHLLRWAHQENLSLLWTHRTGITGVVVVVATPIICFPMMFAKKSMSYEIRKSLHYFFFLFAVVLCFHVPTSALPNGGFIAIVMGFCICLYALDAIFVFIFISEKIETTTFHVLPTGVQMTMNVSERFQKQGELGGFAYVCLPWVDRNQWHPFSLFENPREPSQRQVFMLNVGDWTKAVHAALQRNTARPVWVQGPFASPYSNAEAYDNEILVASGIGITPALSVIRAHKESRRLNLIWVVRDPAMLEFFMEHMYLDHDGWNLIFYTGKKPLNPALEELNTNVRVHKGRPHFKTVIPNIIYGIESGIGKPETYTPSEIASVKRLLIERMRMLDAMDLTNREKLVELTTLASRQGFLFTELINDMGEETHHKKSNVLDNKKRRRRRDRESAYDFGVVKTDDVELGSSDSSGNSPTPSLRESFVLQRIRDFGHMEFPQEEEEDGFDYTSRDNKSQWKRVNREMSRDDSSRSINSHRALRRVRRLRKDLSSEINENSKKVLTSTFDPCGDCENAKQYVRVLDKKAVLSTWGILYCGGSKPVEKDLRRIAMEYDVTLNVESFAW